MTIVEPDSEPLRLTRAWIADVDGVPTPYAEIDGRVCYIETKETLLSAGIASCIPVEGDSDDWPHAVQILEDDGATSRTIWDSTTDLRVVAVVRRWMELARGERSQIGQSLL